MPKSRVTLRALAAEAGVSVATMSLALRHSPEIGATTRARLQRLATRRGYRPEPLASQVMSRLRAKNPARAHVNLCGLGQTWGTPRTRENYFVRLCEGMRQRAESLGCAFSTLDVDDYPGPGRLQQVLLARGVAGLLLLPLRRPGDFSTLLDWEKFSVVSATSSVGAPHFHSVTPGHFENMLLACRELARAGFRRIGLALSREWDLRVRHRWSGGIAWQNHWGGTEPVAPLLYERAGPNLEPAVLQRWLKRQKPDVVILEALDRSSFELAVATLPAARRPKCVTMNWPSPFAAAGVDQQVERIGAVAVELLTGLIARGEKGVPAQPTLSLVTGAWRETPPLRATLLS